MRLLKQSFGLLLAALLLSCEDRVMVVVPVATVEVQGPGAVVAGGTVQLTAVPKDDRGNRLTNRPVSWATSNGTLATVNSGGSVSGVVAGQVTISATCEGRTGTANLQVENPTPSVLSVEPGLVSAGSGTFELTVRGSGFVVTSVVRWNGSDRSTTYVSSEELRVAIQAQDVENAGTVQVTVFNPPPGGGTSGNRPFTVGNPVPSLTSLAPGYATFGSGAITVTVNGSGFVSSSVVVWEGESKPTTYLSPTQLRASVSAADLAAPGWRIVKVVSPAPGGGTSGAKYFAVRIPVTGPFLAAGVYHTCGLSTSGAAYCWGNNYYGQLGDGSYHDSSRPISLMPLSGPSKAVAEGSRGAERAPVAGQLRLVAVTAGYYHSCGLNEVGQAYCWGSNSSGRLGIGTEDGYPEPVPVAGQMKFVSLRGGSRHTCGLTHEGQAYCWGDNQYGQVGDGSGADQLVPVPVQQSSLTFRSLAVGQHHNCGITAEGSLYCWGWNADGQLGDGTENTRFAPTHVPGLGNVSGVTLGARHTCAWTEAGETYCWGSGRYGSLGDGSGSPSNVPLPVSGGLAFRSIQAGLYQNCGVTTSGDVVCWGQGTSGQLGNGEYSSSYVPTDVSGPRFPIGFAAGSLHSCMLVNSGQIYCWGEERYGQLGNGQTSFFPFPDRVQGNPPAFTTVATGVRHSCGLSEEGRTYCWGDGTNGLLGTGDWENHALPVALSSAPDFVALTAGDSHTCGLTSSGAAYCWGYGTSGKLGNGSTYPESTPSPVIGGHSFHEISAGELHTCGVTTSGEVLCWGWNAWGILGDGSESDRSFPAPISAPAGMTFVSVWAGDFHTCALTDTGEAWCWGRNNFGQLGDGSTIDTPTPAKVADLPPNVVTLSLGHWHTCALDSSGQVFCWGNGFPATPQGTLEGYVFSSIDIHQGWTCGLTTTDQGYCWGSNGWGQLGNGSFDSQPDPVEIAGNRQWTTLSVGLGASYHTCGVTLAGEAYCWGHQDRGWLGNGLFGSQSVPVRVEGSIEFGPPVLPAPPRQAPTRALLQPTRRKNVPGPPHLPFHRP